MAPLTFYLASAVGKREEQLPTDGGASGGMLEAAAAGMADGLAGVCCWMEGLTVVLTGWAAVAEIFGGSRIAFHAPVTSPGCFFCRPPWSAAGSGL